MTSKFFQQTLAALSLALLTQPALAQSSPDGAAAQALFDQARALMQQGRAAEACPKLEESQRLDSRSGTLLNLAKCYEDVGRFASAWTKYLEAAPAARAAGNPERETVARDRAAALAPRLAKLVIEVDSKVSALSGLEVKRDGVLVGAPQFGLQLPVDEGEHRLTAQAPGYKPWQTVVVVKGEASVARVSIVGLVVDPDAGRKSILDHGEPGAAHQSTSLGTQRIFAIATGGVGVVGFGLGTFFGLEARSRKSTADKYCTGSACTSQTGVDAGKEARSAGNLATVLFAVGAVGVATGVTLWFTAPGRSGPEQLALDVGPGSVSVRSNW